MLAYELLSCHSSSRESSSYPPYFHINQCTKNKTTHSSSTLKHIPRLQNSQDNLLCSKSLSFSQRLNIMFTLYHETKKKSIYTEKAICIQNTQWFFHWNQEATFRGRCLWTSHTIYEALFSNCSILLSRHTISSRLKIQLGQWTGNQMNL